MIDFQQHFFFLLSMKWDTMSNRNHQEVKWWLRFQRVTVSRVKHFTSITSPKNTKQHNTFKEQTINLAILNVIEIQR